MAFEFVTEQTASVVLVGNFNPAIITPDWLARERIITEDEAAESNIDVIHPDLAQFSVPGFTFEVNSERFVLHARMEPFVRLADLVADLFGDRLKHTPLSAMGINYHAHFRVAHWRQQTALGRLLAPIEPWGEWGKLLEADNNEGVGGLINLTMQQQCPAGRAGGNIKVTVQPSNRIEPGNGVFFQVNDHYDGGPKNESVDYAQVCVDEMDKSLARSRKILANLVETARSL